MEMELELAVQFDDIFDSAGVCSPVARLFISMLKIIRKIGCPIRCCRWTFKWWWENSRSKTDYINTL